MACMKSLPFDAEIDEAGCTDAGHFVLELQCYPQLYANFVTERAQRWDEEPLQPVGRCLEHLITIIIRTVEGSTQGEDNLSLTKAEASAFFKSGGASDPNKIVRGTFGTARNSAELSRVQQRTLLIMSPEAARAGAPKLPDTDDHSGAAPAAAGIFDKRHAAGAEAEALPATSAQLNSQTGSGGSLAISALA